MDLVLNGTIILMLFIICYKIVKIMENYTKEEMIEFGKFCFKKYLIEGCPEEVTHEMLFKMWLKSKNLDMESEIEKPAETEVLNIADVIRSAYFKEQMKMAFKHGREFEQIETDGDMDVTSVEDKNLPFYEWFAKHYA